MTLTRDIYFQLIPIGREGPFNLLISYVYVKITERSRIAGTERAARAEAQAQGIKVRTQ